jgi:hypothetical protein
MIQIVIDRLRASAMPPLVQIDGAEELEALGAGTAARHASAYVVPLREQPDGDPLISAGLYRQRVMVDFSVAIVIRRHDAGKGAARVTAFDTLRNAVETSLIGWSWTPDSIPIVFAGSESQPAGNGVLWHVLTFRTDRLIRRTGIVT